MMTHDLLHRIVARYTPDMLDVIRPATREEISRMEGLGGPFPESYRDFLEWMGNRCPFLDGEELAYAPAEMLELVYEETEIGVPSGFFLVGVDRSGDGNDVYIRKEDGVVTRALYYEHVSPQDMVMENVNLESFLLTAYLRRTLVRSHPYHFSAWFTSTNNAQLDELRRRVRDACTHFDIQHPVEQPDFDFHGGPDFVVGIHQRPRSQTVYLHFGTVERVRFEPWYDLVFARWRLSRLPE